MAGAGEKGSGISSRSIGVVHGDEQGRPILLALAAVQVLDTEIGTHTTNTGSITTFDLQPFLPLIVKIPTLAIRKQYNFLRHPNLNDISAYNIIRRCQ